MRSIMNPFRDSLGKIETLSHLHRLKNKKTVLFSSRGKNRYQVIFTDYSFGLILFVHENQFVFGCFLIIGNYGARPGLGVLLVWEGPKSWVNSPHQSF